MRDIHCPKCQYRMGVENRKTSRGPTGKQYNWSQHHCQRDDIWIELETPLEEDED